MLRIVIANTYVALAVHLKKHAYMSGRNEAEVSSMVCWCFSESKRWMAVKAGPYRYVHDLKAVSTLVNPQPKEN